MNNNSLAYIGIGSNLNEPPERIRAALQALRRLPDCGELHCAPWYQSVAVGPGEQPDYINTVVGMNTRLPPMALLLRLQSIENRQGRQRDTRWGPRTLDLDLLLYGSEIIDTNNLKVPHPAIPDRNFVLLPLFDLAPQLVMPNGISLAELIIKCDSSGLKKIEQ